MVLLGSVLLLIGIPAGTVSAQTAAPPVDIELLINRGQQAEARTALASFPQKTRADSARALYLRGRIELNAGTLPDAVKSLEKSVHLVPRNGATQYWLAIAYIRSALGSSRLQQALYARRVRTALERSTEYSPRLVDARLHLMQYYLRAPFFMGGSRDKARAQADTIFQIEPLRGHMARAQVAEASGDLKTAEREFAAAMNEFPKNETGYHALGGFYRRVRNYARAVDVFQKLQQVSPNQAAAHLQIGRTIAEWGQQLDRGEKELETALSMQLGPLDAATAHYNLGLIYQRRGDRARAKERFDRALALDPTFELAVQARKSVK